jgi:uncharacterized protein
MEIQQETTADRGEFYIEKDGARVAKIQYFDSREGEVTVYHTEVADELSGQGIGKRLVHRMAEYASERGVKIRATCPYAHKVLERSDEHRDVLVG